MTLVMSHHAPPLQFSIRPVPPFRFGSARFLASPMRSRNLVYFHLLLDGLSQAGALESTFGTCIEGVHH